MNPIDRQTIRERIGPRTILGIALDVHSTNNGSMERSKKEQTSDQKLLRDVLIAWLPSSLSRYQRFDNAVKELVEASLAEQHWAGI